MDIKSASIEQLKRIYLTEIRDKNLAKDKSDDFLLEELCNAFDGFNIEEFRERLIKVIRTYQMVNVPTKCPYCNSHNYKISSTYSDYYYCGDCKKGDPINP